MAAVQSLRRYEPDQVRRISAPQVREDVPAVSQPLAGDLPGTASDLVPGAASVNPDVAGPAGTGEFAGLAATDRIPIGTNPLERVSPYRGRHAASSAAERFRSQPCKQIRNLIRSLFLPDLNC